MDRYAVAAISRFELVPRSIQFILRASVIAGVFVMGSLALLFDASFLIVLVHLDVEQVVGSCSEDIFGILCDLLVTVLARSILEYYGRDVD